MMTTEPERFEIFTHGAWEANKDMIERMLVADDLADLLNSIRCDLNGSTPGSSWWGSAPARIQSQRQIVLDAVARRICELRGWDVRVLASDLLEDAPDDAAGLDDNRDLG